MTAVSAPRMKKVQRSEALVLENWPSLKCEKRIKMPGTSCSEAMISIANNKIPTGVKSLMLKL